MKQGCVNTQNESGKGGGDGGYLEPKETHNQATLLQIFVNPRQTSIHALVALKLVMEVVWSSYGDGVDCNSSPLVL